MLGLMDPKITQVALNGLENILRVGEQDAKVTGQNRFALLVEECCGEFSAGGGGECCGEFSAGGGGSVPMAVDGGEGPLVLSGELGLISRLPLSHAFSRWPIHR